METRPGTEQGAAFDGHHSLRVPWLPGYPGFPLSLIDTFDFSHRYGERHALHTVRLALSGAAFTSRRPWRGDSWPVC